MVTVRPASVGNDEVAAAMQGKAMLADATPAAARKWRRDDPVQRRAMLWTLDCDGFIWELAFPRLQDDATGALSFGQCLAAAGSRVELRP